MATSISNPSATAYLLEQLLIWADSAGADVDIRDAVQTGWLVREGEYLEIVIHDPEPRRFLCSVQVILEVYSHPEEG